MPDFSRRDIIKQGIGAFLTPRDAIRAVNTVMQSLPRTSRIDLKKYGIDTLSLLNAVIDGEEYDTFETNEDRSITLSNGKTIPGDKVAAIIKDGLKELSIEDFIEYMTSYFMGTAEYDEEYGVFSDIVIQIVDRVGLRTFVRAVIAADDAEEAGPSIEHTRFEKLQDLLVNFTKGELFPESNTIIFSGGGSYTDNINDIVALLKKQGFLKPVEAAKILRYHKDFMDQTKEWEQATQASYKQHMLDRDVKQSDPDWYHNSSDPYIKTKERFHESRIHCFTSSYKRFLFESAGDVSIRYYDGERDALRICQQIASEEIYVSRDKDLLAYAVLDGRIIGCVFYSVSKIPDEWYYSDDEFEVYGYKPDTMAFSFDVVVNSEHRGVNAGPLLIQAAMKEFKDMESEMPVVLLLEVVNPKLAKYMMRKYGLRSINPTNGEFYVGDVYNPAARPFLSR